MKRAILALVALVALATATVVQLPESTQAAPQSIRVDRGTQLYPAITENQWSGTLCITIDDGLLWVYTDLLDTLQAINADSGLVGTPWEMGASVFANVEGANGLRDREPSNTDKLNSTELKALHQAREIEVGLHGYWAGINDPSAVQSPWGVTGFRWNQDQANSDSTTYEIIVDGTKALRDTILGDPNSIVSYVTNGHRITNYGVQLASQMGIRNIRSGTILEGTSNNWPLAANGGGGSNATERGQVREQNRRHIDRAHYVWTDYSDLTHACMLPAPDLHRLWMPHQRPPSSAQGIGASGAGGSAERADSTEAIMYHLAETNGFGILVWHGINLDTGAQSIGGMDGVGEVLRYAAGLCRNGLLRRDAPKLQVLTLDAGTTKMTNWRLGLAGQSVNMVGNFFMRQGRATDRPHGHPDFLVDVWADSGWTYIDSTTAAGNGAFGIHGTGGCLLNASGNADIVHDLILMSPVLPESRACISLWASVDTANVANSAQLDSLESAVVDLQIRYLVDSNDPSDTTATWVDGVQSAAMDQADWNLFKSNWSTEPTVGQGWNSGNNGSNRFSRVKQRSAFHSRDLWRIARDNHGAQSDWWFDNDTINDDDEYTMRWREFYMFVDIPAGVRAIRVLADFASLGTAAETDTVLVSGFEVNCTVR